MLPPPSRHLPPPSPPGRAHPAAGVPRKEKKKGKEGKGRKVKKKESVFIADQVLKARKMGINRMKVLLKYSDAGDLKPAFQEVKA
ncbi:hypothetical protein E2562_021456 [Oryza meyeriana var. granulata]|uniref:Uncharacterized protein n=1 Tax=Oryza meyeriana var. granulata TaxID=110450 RepID=A0A6G1C8E2_9ORYZ|nr:hypothetical protein E2562_021456 [Oryza meyeriana var. granulata]